MPRLRSLAILLTFAASTAFSAPPVLRGQSQSTSPTEPVVRDVNPRPAVAGKQITVVGTNFGDSGGNVVLRLNKQPIPTTSWESEKIQGILRAGTPAGDPSL